MPEIIVTAGQTAHHDETVTWRERVNAEDFESERFAANLVERLGWAVVDATEAEHESDRVPTGERRITGSRRREQQREPELEPVGSA